MKKSDAFEAGGWKAARAWSLTASANVGPDLMHLLQSRTVMVTGAGGSIGAALVRALGGFRLRRLVLLDSSENNLYELECRLRSLQPGAASEGTVPVVCDVADRSMLRGVMEQYRPEIILHAAACKQVPLMERNPFAAVRTNTIGTWNLVALAAAHGCQRLVMVSTDKAVDPVSIMGASKRMAEMVLLGWPRAEVQMTAVRLGNVLGSAGSVVPLFERQIAHGGPVTVTDREAHRYFVSMERSVTILLAALRDEVAGAFARDWGRRLLVPAMDEPVRILELAQSMIREAGKAGEIAIKFIGLRPGEKLRELLISSGEDYLSSDHSTLRLVRSPSTFPDGMMKTLLLLEKQIEEQNLRRMLSLIQETVPAYAMSDVLRREAEGRERISTDAGQPANRGESL